MVMAATFYSPPRFSTYTSTIVMRMGVVCVCSWTIHDPFVYVQLIQLLYTFLRIRFYIYVLCVHSTYTLYIRFIYISYISYIYVLYIRSTHIYFYLLTLRPLISILPTLSTSINNPIKAVLYTYLSILLFY